jgi:hypothetical protein
LIKEYEGKSLFLVVSQIDLMQEREYVQRCVNEIVRVVTLYQLPFYFREILKGNIFSSSTAEIHDPITVRLACQKIETTFNSQIELEEYLTKQERLLMPPVVRVPMAQFLNELNSFEVGILDQRKKDKKSELYNILCEAGAGDYLLKGQTLEQLMEMTPERAMKNKYIQSTTTEEFSLWWDTTGNKLVFVFGKGVFLIQ